MGALFLDANIFLDFYRYGADDITEIGKLVALLRDGEVRLFLNPHLRAEVERLREGILASSFGELRSTKYSVRPPNYSKGLVELDTLNGALRAANEAHAALVATLEKKIQGRELPADELITEIFQLAVEISLGVQITDSARLRRDLGNPPGKRGELGDAINWESLMEAQLTSLDIVSRDGDFDSELNPGNLKAFLFNEWRSKKGKYSQVILYKSLSDYFRARFPNIKLSDEARKTDLIDQLRTSSSFSATHKTIAELNEIKYFTTKQKMRLFEILVENPQVGRIATDTDVKDFYLSIKNDAWLLSDDIVKGAAHLLDVPEEDLSIPF